MKKPDHLITVFAGVDKDAVDATFLHHRHGFVQKTENWFIC
jgi:hypothetical protein